MESYLNRGIPLSLKKISFFINTLQKREKKTNFSAVTTLVSRLRGILGCGCHPLFANIEFDILKESALTSFIRLYIIDFRK